MRHIILCLMIAAGLVPSAGARAEKKPYSLEDLQALDQRGAWDELLWHLTDVPPLQRGAAWNRVVEHACLRPMSEYYMMEACADQLDAAAAAEPKNQAFALKVAQFFGRSRFQSLAVRFFARVVTTPDDAQCASPELASAAVAGMRHSAIDEDKELVAAAQKLALTLCWKATREAVLKMFDRDGTRPYLLNTCPALKREGALTPAQDALCDREMARR